MRARRACLSGAGRLLLAAGALLAAPRPWAQPSRLPDIVARSRPSLVLVGTFGALDSPRFGFRGAGFAVGDGLSIVTCAHVLPEGWAGAAPGRIVVAAPRPADGGAVQPRPVRVLEVDAARDLALLRIEAGEPLPALPLAEAGAAREGQAIALMGFPIGGLLGYAPVTHAGIVSSITTLVPPPPTAGQLTERAIRQLRAGPVEILQLDATAYPGNSGGPVLDAETGQVVGVVNMVLRLTRESPLAQPTGLTYAVPVRAVHELLQRPPAR